MTQPRSSLKIGGVRAAQLTRQEQVANFNKENEIRGRSHGHTIDDAAIQLKNNTQQQRASFPKRVFGRDLSNLQNNNETNSQSLLEVQNKVSPPCESLTSV